MFRCLIFLFTAVPLLADELKSADTVLQLLDARAGALKSWQANFIKTTAQGAAPVTQSGTVRFAHTATGEKGRADYLMQIGGRDLTCRVVSGTDNVVWQTVSASGKQAIYKLDLNKPITGSTEDPRKHNPINEFNPFDLLRQFRPQLDFTLDPPQEIGGRRFYQLVGKPKASVGAGQLPLGALRLWIGVDDGFLHRVVVSDLRGNPALVMDLSGVRLNIELEKTLFTFAPPDGANIQDLNSRIGKVLQ